MSKNVIATVSGRGRPPLATLPKHFPWRFERFDDANSRPRDTLDVATPTGPECLD